MFGTQVRAALGGELINRFDRATLYKSTSRKILFR
jgi:hypothetical protein